MIISIIGLGYVGLPIAIAFAEKDYKVIGFDINNEKINLLKKEIDPTEEIGSKRLKKTNNILFTSNEKELINSNFHIVAVPTPVGKAHVPDLNPLEKATEIVARNLKQDDIVVYESTVYPGVTEEICIPILEKISGLKLGKNFKVGYSPERINPGDKINTLENIVKIVSGSDEEALKMITSVYEKIIKAGVHKVSSIKTAEATKVIENAQRDVNIAFMNELSIIFNMLDIDTKEVLEAAETKWNFLKFYPGLVGGHCIGIDPYYLTYKSEDLGYVSQLILSARRINDKMGNFVADNTIKKMIKSKINVSKSKILVLGITFKENCSDIRNSKVIDIIKEFVDYGIEVLVNDPIADKVEIYNKYGLELKDLYQVKDIDAVVIAVAHDEYKNLSCEFLANLYKENQPKILIDIKGIYYNKKFKKIFNYWSL